MEKRYDLTDLIRAYIEWQRHPDASEHAPGSHHKRYRALSRLLGVDYEAAPACYHSGTHALRKLLDAAVDRALRSTNPFDDFREGSESTGDLWKSYGRRIAAAEEERQKALLDLIRELTVRLYGAVDRVVTQEELDREEPSTVVPGSSYPEYFPPG